MGQLSATTRLTLGAVLALVCGAPAFAAILCTAPSFQSAAPKDTTITSVESMTVPVRHCQVEGFVTTRNPGPNRVRFLLQLPSQNWNGRYYFIGVGAAAGHVPTESEVPGGNPIVKGWAVAGTDTGHEANGLDWSFLRDPAKALDHAYRGGHVAAVATQQLTKAYYGVSTMYRYHCGCSGGGRMGMQAMMHYPGDFDGLLIGDPGERDAMMMLKLMDAARQELREPGAWVSPAKLALVDKHVTAACDATDGAHDGVVWDHRLCQFDVASLKCPESVGDASDCLTEPEIRTLKAILAGPRGPKGQLLAEPMPITNMSVWAPFLGESPPPWNGTSPTAINGVNGNLSLALTASVLRAFFGPNYDVTQFNLSSQNDIDAWRRVARRVQFFEYTPDLRSLAKSGAKVLLWNGRSDPCCSDIELEQYYRDVVKMVGGHATEFIALYQIPGMGHCGGGTGPQDAPDQLLEALVNWVEKSAKPGPIVSHRGATSAFLFMNPRASQTAGMTIPVPSGTSRDFLLCPFPEKAHFDSTPTDNPGAVNNASNWHCNIPAPGNAL